MTKKYKINHAKEHKMQAHCPICSRYKAYNTMSVTQIMFVLSVFS